MSVLIITVGLLGLEGAYRLYKWKKYGMVETPNIFTVGVYVVDPVYGKVPQKNFKFEDLDPRLRNPANGVQGFDKKVSFNSLGYRGKEFSAAKPPQTYRIVVLGDAATLGLECDDPDTWPARLEERLQKDSAFLRRHGVARAEVINGAFVGWRTREGLLRLQNEVIHFDPDVLMVAFNKNDAYKAMQGRDAHATIFPSNPPRLALLENLSIRYANRVKGPENYKSMLTYLRRDAAWAQAYADNVAAMKTIADRIGSTMVLVNLPGVSRNEDRQTPEYQLIIESNILTPGIYVLWARLQSFMSGFINDLGTKYDVPVIDAHKYFYKFKNGERIKLFTAMGHPSCSGAESVAEAIYAARDAWDKGAGHGKNGQRRQA